ncbi:ornithine cyclodeaminase family protein [Pseudomonas putida]|uniref:ornithine cyclodeaminase family protein n=1 Tax=Pseudomonas putida TaxID=303 RepID=UPI0006B48FDE|nr:ornithine cyclodeaminase family protein [Pseudomonas putida]USX36097.1 ornithine cyclodeaminase family protein [Pseudomonas putida]
MHVLSSHQTTALLPFEQLIQALEAYFQEGCEVPLRHNHSIAGNNSGEDGILLLMPAWQPGKRLGVKTVSIFPNNHVHGLPGLHSVFILYDAVTGAPVAILDGDVITSRRTAAASALAAKRLSRPDSNTLLVVGAGRVGSLLPDAYRTVRPIERVFVWDLRREAADALVTKLRAQGINAQAMDDLADAAQKADIITCATLSNAPLIQGEWLRPGTHLDLIGSFTPAMRESDDECFQKSTVFIDTSEALLKAGDVLAPMETGVFSEQQVAATLEQLCRNQHPGRTSVSEITLFKAVGTALEDLAAASLAYDTFLDKHA